jgi:hypothetical protein
VFGARGAAIEIADLAPADGTVRRYRERRPDEVGRGRSSGREIGDFN